MFKGRQIFYFAARETLYGEESHTAPAHCVLRSCKPVWRGQPLAVILEENYDGLKEGKGTVDMSMYE
jgi:hypothetical protein